MKALSAPAPAPAQLRIPAARTRDLRYPRQRFLHSNYTTPPQTFAYRWYATMAANMPTIRITEFLVELKNPCPCPPPPAPLPEAKSLRTPRSRRATVEPLTASLSITTWQASDSLCRSDRLLNIAARRSRTSPRPDVLPPSLPRLPGAAAVKASADGSQ